AGQLATNGGAFGGGRKGADGINAGFDFVEYLEYIKAFGNFYRDYRPALARARADGIDAVQIADGFFDADGNLLLNFGGPCARINHLDINKIARHDRKNFLIQTRQAHDAANKNQRH